MIKNDEKQLWNAVLEQWDRVKDSPNGVGERLVSAWSLGKNLKIPEKRIEYLSEKWNRQGKWVLLGTMIGTDVVAS